MTHLVSPRNLLSILVLPGFNYDRPVTSATSKRRLNSAIEICPRLLFDPLSTWRVFQVLHSTAYTSSPLLRSPFLGACCHTWVCYEFHKGSLVGADKPSQELCDGPTIHQPPYASRGSGGMGAPRWETVWKKAFACENSDICKENETRRSVFLKGSTF